MTRVLMLPPNCLGYYRLPLTPFTCQLSLATLNQHSAFRKRERPYLYCNTEEKSFDHGVLVLEVIVERATPAQLVYICVRDGELWVACNAGTDEQFLSRHAYMTLFSFMGYSDENADFEAYNWYDFFEESKKRSKYLNYINDRRGMDITLKTKYAYFVKPGEVLLELQYEEKIFTPNVFELANDAVNLENEYQLGYGMVDTLMRSMHSNHYPFLIPFYGKLNKNNTEVKVFVDFVRGQDQLPLLNYTLQQESLNQICEEMAVLAAIPKISYHCNEAEKLQILETILLNKTKLFSLWHQAYALLLTQPFTQYYYTYGLSILSHKIYRRGFIKSGFLKDQPVLFFIWKDKGAFYELELRFKVKKRQFLPHQSRTVFFISAAGEPYQFYLLISMADEEVVSFFAKHNFKISMLKQHYESNFKDFMVQLAKVYEVLSS